ncbi:AMIN-like domain-containing (lipo)protein [Actinomyces faecalis]|uniref:AMIN-like domain-containing (lipo)protein n=1 Tax=Actinomyces faecalis TaxID=2722820 RepID=UPI0015558CE9|nr:AMIN domain-containing protein [Actinomyces faecalis]
MTTSPRTTSRSVACPTRRGVLVGGLGAALAGGLAACGSARSGSAASSVSPSTTSSPAPSATPSASASATATSQALTAQESAQGPEVAWTDGHCESEPSGEAGVETSLRTGIHEGYDRVVVQTSGTGTIGWFADVVEEASTQGKGDPLSLEGSHLIRVYGRGTQMPVTEQDQQIDYDGPALVNAGGTALKQVYLDRTFEDQFQLVLGTESTQYRVFTLSEPSRLVIDVRQP